MTRAYVLNPRKFTDLTFYDRTIFINDTPYGLPSNILSPIDVVHCVYDLGSFKDVDRYAFACPGVGSNGDIKHTVELNAARDILAAGDLLGIVKLPGWNKDQATILARILSPRVAEHGAPNLVVGVEAVELREGAFILCPKIDSRLALSPANWASSTVEEPPSALPAEEEWSPPLRKRFREEEDFDE